jgi:hypothetical protein
MVDTSTTCVPASSCPQEVGLQRVQANAFLLQTLLSQSEAALDPVVRYGL